MKQFKVKLNSLSDEKLIMRLSGINLSDDALRKRISKIKHFCNVRIERMLGDMFVMLESNKHTVDLHISAATLLKELRQAT